MLETERLLHRRFTKMDLEELLAIRGDQAVAQYIGGPKASTREWIQGRLQHYLEGYQTLGFSVHALLWKETRQLIGWSGLQPTEDNTAIQLTYGLAQSHWRQGIGYETAAAWLYYGFNTLDLEQIVAVTHLHNTGSWRLMEKLGMTFQQEQHSYGVPCKLYAISKEGFSNNGLLGLK